MQYEISILIKVVSVMNPDRNDGIPNSNHNINNRKKYKCEKYGFSNLTQLKI